MRAAQHLPQSVSAIVADKQRRLEVLVAAGVFVLALIPRVVWAAAVNRGPAGFNDPVFYDLFGHSIADGHGYVRLNGQPFAYYPVGYPAMLGALYWLLDHTFLPDQYILAAKVLNGFLGAGTVLITYLLAFRLLGRVVALLTAFLLAIFPSQVYYAGTLLTEPLFTFLLMLALLMLLWRPWQAGDLSLSRALVAGLLLGAATLVRAITLPLFAVLGVAWWMATRRPTQGIAMGAVLAVGTAAFVVPWSIRNTLRLHAPVIVSTNAGDDLCIGHHEGATGVFRLEGPCFEDTGRYETDMDREIGRNREGMRMAWNYMRSHPLDEFRLLGLKALYLMSSDSDGIYAVQSYNNDVFMPESRRGALAFAANAIYLSLFAWALLGLVRLTAPGDVRRRVAVAVMLYLLLIPLVFFGDPRFHFPAIPLAVMTASTAIVAVWRRRRGAALGRGEQA